MDFDFVYFPVSIELILEKVVVLQIAVFGLAEQIVRAFDFAYFVARTELIVKSSDCLDFVLEIAVQMSGSFVRDEAKFCLMVFF